MKKTLALILAVLMLCSVVLIATSAEDDFTVDWEALTNKYGYNIYIGEATDVPPVLDGVINDGEYQFTRVQALETLNGYATGEIQSNIEEFYGHDADYIYIGARFEQANNNRAYWIQWKPFNTFDVFRDNSDLTKYYYQRCSTQIRYQDDGSTTNSGFAWNNAMDVALPTVGEGEDAEYRYCAAKIVDEENEIYTKTIEVRIAKSYIATVSGCEVADVRVLPFWTWFHANLCSGALMSVDFAIEASELDFTAYVPSGDANMYWFLVLDNEPVAEETTTEATTTEAPTTEATTTEAPTTEAPTTEAPTTEAPTTEAPTTAAPTTAAPTTEATTTAAPTTEASTEATTTAAPTTTAAATTAATTAAADKGCGSSVAISALVIVPTIAGGALLLKRRKED